MCQATRGVKLDAGVRQGPPLCPQLNRSILREEPPLWPQASTGQKVQGSGSNPVTTRPRPDEPVTWPGVHPVQRRVQPQPPYPATADHPR